MKKSKSQNKIPIVIKSFSLERLEVRKVLGIMRAENYVSCVWSETIIRVSFQHGI